MSATMELTEIGYAVEDRVATITLSRPDRLNAYRRRGSCTVEDSG